jgi:thiaminase/transcriptional activator TenA
MVNEIATGALPHPRFRHYFEQNIAYLGDYTRAIAAITAKAPDADALDALGGLLEQIITVELPANRSFLERLGGDPATVRDATTMEPVTYAYTRHLLATAALGDCAAGLAAVLPCQWSYGEIGAQIRGAQPDDPIYADWIGVFGNTEYAGLVEVTTALLDRLAPPDVGSFRRLQAIFDASTRYEVEFWDMAYEPLASHS